MPTRVVLSVVVLGLFGGIAKAQSQNFVVVPAEVKLEGNFARAQLLVIGSDAQRQTSDRSPDLTSTAKFRSSDPNVVQVSGRGLLLARGDGQAKVAVEVGETTHEVPVTVSSVLPQAKVAFTEHIRPILNKAGCAMAACHAAQHGKGGFKLSVFGSDPGPDWTAMTRESIQRRIDFVRPENSLLILKPTMLTPHGGGRRIENESVEHQLFVEWLKGGAAGPKDSDPEVVKLHVTPSRRVAAYKDTQQLRVEAEYANGVRRDVTPLARFDSMDDGMLAVNSDGLVTVVGQGQAPIMVRFEGQAEISLFIVPYAERVPLAGWQNQNFVDELAVAKFKELGIEPSPVCDDATFVRRAFLDAIGTLPSPEETLAFVNATEPDKRTRLVDQLLGLSSPNASEKPLLPGGQYNDWYAAYWSLKWSDLIRNNSRSLGEQGMWALHNWVRESFRVNKPFDQFVRELITAKGSIYRNGPANYFRINANPSDLTEATSQIFLGIRLECAKCHHHPFEKYSEDDYYGMSAFFARVGTKNSEEFGLFGGEQAVVVRDAGEVSRPRGGKRMAPKPLDGPAMEHPLDRRLPLADWLTSKDNAWFARNIANRYVHYLLGRGLVEPVDDMRSTNPPTNPPLLDALAKHLADSGYNLKQLMRVLMTSRLYQLDSQPTSSNAGDWRFYSHFPVKRLAAEPLADAIDRVTGVQTKYKNLPLGTRAIELADAEYPDYFLTTFAKPRRASVCECERSPDANLAQALHTLNGDLLASKIADKGGRIAKLLAAQKPHEEIVTELYLVTLCRPPSESERAAAKEIVSESPSPEEGFQDLLWALVNSKHFLFVR